MESSLEAARQVPRIGTHSGTFHCDESLACFLLKLLPQYKNAEIIRTRDDDLLNKCDIVVDVGAEYNPEKHRYDHHQKNFCETMSSLVPGKPWTIKLSSAGLVYCHFGREIIQQISSVKLDEKELEAIFDYVYENFVQEIDAIDNGIPICDGERRYKITTSISSRVSYLNPDWNSPPVDPSSLQYFEKAMAMTGIEFVDKVEYAIKHWWPARKLVLQAINDRFTVHESGQIMELTQFCPWKQHYFEIMKDLQMDPSSINFVIFQDDSWRVQGVPEAADSFLGKIFLNAKWRGLRNEELSKVSGIEDCVFVHASGFIGGNKTREGAIQMALMSINQHAASNSKEV